MEKTDEKISILEVLKDIKRNEIYVKQRELEQLNNKYQELRKKQDLPIPYKKYNFFQKYIFKRKEYKEYEHTIDQCNKEKNDLFSEAQIIRQEIEAIEHLNLEEILVKIDKAEKLEQLGISSEKEAESMLIEYFETKKTSFSELSYEEMFKILPETTSKSPKFMSYAIEENPDFIQYDKTDYKELYIKYIGFLKEKVPFTTTLEELDLYLEELKRDEEKVSKTDKYRIPLKYMFEDLRLLDKATYSYIRLNEKFSKEFGTQLEELYEDPDTILGMHSTEDKSAIDGIMTGGLKQCVSFDWWKKPCLASTVRYGEKMDMKFLIALDYYLPAGGNKDICFILQIPKKAFDSKDPMPIWGSDNKEGTDNFVLPQYIYGYYKKSDGENRTIVRNSKTPQKYKFLKYDGESIKKDSEPVLFSDHEENLRE